MTESSPDISQRLLHRIDRRNRAIVLLVAVFLILVLAMVSLTAAGVYFQSRRLVDLATQSRETGALLVDCTTPSTDTETHECWDRLRSGNEGTSDAVRRLYCVPLVLAGYLPEGCADVATIIADLPRSAS